MPDNLPRTLPSPWDDFLTELDAMLTDSLELHCVGGFVFVHFYGVRRSTGDIDYFTVVPNVNLDELAGEESLLRQKHGIWLQRVPIANLPDGYEARLKEMAPGQFSHLKLMAPDPYDCILSKLERNSMKDRDDADYIFRAQGLDSRILRERYEKELRYKLIGNVGWHDRTLELWIEIFEAGIGDRL